MTRKELAAELLSMRQRAEETAQNIERIAIQLGDERQSLREVVDEYGRKRIELFKQELEAHGITWCTDCGDVISLGHAVLLLVKGKKKYSGGYGNGSYGFQSFVKLHRACSACRKHAAERHGWQGLWNSQASSQASFYAFLVEKREDSYYAHEFGEWVKLDEENCKLDDVPPGRLVQKFAAEWGLPPSIELDTQWLYSPPKLIIHEEAATAIAS